MTPRVHIVGRKNSGKTTLIVDLVRQLSAMGCRVGTVKHTHHQHELDTPGKDSHRHRQAGAAAVGILSPGMMALFRPAQEGEDLSGRYDLLLHALADCDLVLVEGHSQIEGCKVEVWRAAVSQNPLASSDPDIRAVITDDHLPLATTIWSRSDIARLAQRVLQLGSSGK